MSAASTSTPQFSRRFFMAAGAAASTLPLAAALPATPPRYKRRDISGAGFPQRTLDSYRRAIRAMLALPPSDPRNWYRHALTHALDCPHGNWWFLPWHRAYLGWFERTCRELSGDPEFALPYWDWTRQPRVPAAMFEGVLTPDDPLYIRTLGEFETRFRPAVAVYWRGLSAAQLAALAGRGLATPNALWSTIGDPAEPFFFRRAHARGLTPAQPDFDDTTRRAVSVATLRDALAASSFMPFASLKAAQHSALAGYGVLEGQPHNCVHNCLGGIFTHPSGKTTDSGGFMQANLSPVDPLFFLHHANLDRLWDVWTRKQLVAGEPTLPEGADLALWSDEPFLFYTDGRGRPLGPSTAADYAAIGRFDYGYQPGSGEEIVHPSPVFPKLPAGSGRVAATIANAFAGTTTATNATAALPSSLVASRRLPRFTATITLAPAQICRNGAAESSRDAVPHHGDYVVVANAPAEMTAAAPSSPHFVATLSTFCHHAMTGPFTFTVPLTQTVENLIGINKLSAAAPSLHFRVLTPPGVTAEILSIWVEAH